ncbi:MAG TPA: glycosyltransferase family 4 protein [Candidatus Acidoferrum sp.]|nr:glycosyltransferase family 4 protein [Candidatus Acidoferrum sp.]
MSRVVWHLVDAMGTGEELWGKERVVAEIMLAQRRAGHLDPRLICFTAGGLSRFCAAAGIHVERLESSPSRIPHRSLPALLAILRTTPGAVLHTHGYKANIVGRLARLSGAPLARVVATCHGWPDETPATRTYNILDRWSAFLSDATTVPDGRMLRRFPAFARTRARHVANAIPDREPTSPQRRREARARFGWDPGAFVAGTIGRLTPEKGVSDALLAAESLRSDGVVWAFAGSGPLEPALRAAGDHVACAGYVTPSGPFLDALDAFVQSSHSEGLSLALLEAMRAALPIVATDVGATCSAVRDDVEALIVPPHDPDALAAALRRIVRNPSLGQRLGAAARERFERSYRIERQAHDFELAYGLSS